MRAVCEETVEVGVNPRVERSQLYIEQLVTQVAQTVEVAARVLLPQISHQPVSTYDITSATARLSHEVRQ